MGSRKSLTLTEMDREGEVEAAENERVRYIGDAE